MENISPYFWEFVSYTIFMAIAPVVMIALGINYKKVADTILGYAATIATGLLGFFMIIMFFGICGLPYIFFFVSINLIAAVVLYESYKVYDFHRRRQDPYYDTL